MRAVVQRVTRASVSVESRIVGQIDAGLMVLLGVGTGDGPSDVALIADKVANLRIFDDDAGQMNRSVRDVSGSVLVVSQFTLYGDARNGRRPGYTAAARPEEANPLYEQVVEALRGVGLTVATGVFRTTMAVELVNDGPVTILLDSRKGF
jgi:D-tyrosyl-tRNA(Tyr) deacylase